MTQAQLELEEYKLEPVPLQLWQIKKEPLVMIWKTCRKCLRELELWSDDIEDSDPFWCNFCTEAEHAGRTSIGRILYPNVSYTMANNLPHLTIRWTQPLCVSSHMNWQQMFYTSFSLIRMVIKFEFICGRSLNTDNELPDAITLLNPQAPILITWCTSIDVLVQSFIVLYMYKCPE